MLCSNHACLWIAACLCQMANLVTADIPPTPSQYDKAVTTFSPDGSLHQIRYANRACAMGLTSFAMALDSNEIVVCLESSPQNQLVDKDITRKIHPVCEGVWAVISGLTGDGLALIREARKFCLNHETCFDAPPPVETVSRHIAKTQHAATLKGGKAKSCG